MPAAPRRRATLPRSRRCGEPEQMRAADEGQSRRVQHRVEPLHVLAEPALDAGKPGMIGKRLRADVDRGPRHRPGPERLAQRRGVWSRRLARSRGGTRRAHRPWKGAQHHEARLRQKRRQAQALLLEIGEGLIDNHQPAFRSRIDKVEQGCGVVAPSIRIIRIADDDAAAPRPNRRSSAPQRHCSSRGEGAGIFAIGGREDRDTLCRDEPRQQRDQDLRSRRGNNEVCIGGAIGLRRRRPTLQFPRARAAGSRPGGKLRNWIGQGIDPRRQIDEGFRRLG